MNGGSPSRGGSKGGVVFGIVLAAAIGLLVAIFWTTFLKYREVSSRQACAMNLRAIGLAMIQYAGENSGRLPPDLPTLLDAQLISPTEARCPVAEEDDCYFFVEQPRFGGVSPENLPPFVMVVERPSNHRGRGMNVLYADGEVVWFDEPTASDVIAELVAGRNPPVLK